MGRIKEMIGDNPFSPKKMEWDGRPPVHTHDPPAAYGGMRRALRQMRGVKKSVIIMLRQAGEEGLTDGELEEMGTAIYGPRKGDQYRKRRSDLTGENMVVPTGKVRLHQGVSQTVWKLNPDLFKDGLGPL